MPPSALAAGRSFYPLTEFDPSGFEPIMEVNLGLEISNIQPCAVTGTGMGQPCPQPPAHGYVGLWAVTMPCPAYLSPPQHSPGQDLARTLLSQCQHA